MKDDRNQTFSPSATGPRRGVSRVVVGAAVGLLLASLAVGLALGLFRGEPLPELTEQALRQAQAKWESLRPADYSLDVAVEGVRAGTIHLEVERGEPTQMTRDGVSPAQKRTWSYWTIPGMFDLIEEEMVQAREQAPFGAAAGSRVIQRARFDPQWGFPAEYWRTVLGTSLEIRFRVEQFRPADPGTLPAPTPDQEHSR